MAANHRPPSATPQGVFRAVAPPLPTSSPTTTVARKGAPPPLQKSWFKPTRKRVTSSVPGKFKILGKDVFKTGRSVLSAQFGWHPSRRRAWVNLDTAHWELRPNAGGASADLMGFQSEKGDVFREYESRGGSKQGAVRLEARVQTKHCAPVIGGFCRHNSSWKHFLVVNYQGQRREGLKRVD